MHLTMYVLGKIEPVFTGDVTTIPSKGERVVVGEAPDFVAPIETPYVVESVCWTLKGGVLSAFVYLMGYRT